MALSPGNPEDVVTIWCLDGLVERGCAIWVVEGDDDGLFEYFETTSLGCLALRIDAKRRECGL